MEEWVCLRVNVVEGKLIRGSTPLSVNTHSDHTERREEDVPEGVCVLRWVIRFTMLFTLFPFFPFTMTMATVLRFWQRLCMRKMRAGDAFRKRAIPCSCTGRNCLIITAHGRVIWFMHIHTRMHACTSGTANGQEKERRETGDAGVRGYEEEDEMRWWGRG
jgi:hypothetical protein